MAGFLFGRRAVTPGAGFRGRRWTRCCGESENFDGVTQEMKPVPETKSVLYICVALAEGYDELDRGRQ